jgi:uncharacterized protein (DUF1697 family)
MEAIICMLRGVNVGGRNKIKMEELRVLLESMKLKSPQTYVQSGNVVFLFGEKNLAGLTKKIQDGIEKKFGFRPDVVLRTADDVRKVVAKNPFAKRKDVEAAKLLVCFLSAEPGKTARENLQKFDARGEELHFHGNELFIYFKNGIGQTKLSWAGVDKAIGCSSTGRNWNTVTKLLEMAEGLEKG